MTTATRRMSADTGRKHQVVSTRPGLLQRNGQATKWRYRLKVSSGAVNNAGICTRQERERERKNNQRQKTNHKIIMMTMMTVTMITG